MKNKLPDQIAKGINKSIIGRAIKGIVYGILIILVVIFLFLFIPLFLPNQPQIAIEPDSCSLPWVICEVIMGNETEEHSFYSNRFCGYQEAESFFILQNNTWIAQIGLINEKENLNFKLKRFECE